MIIRSSIWFPLVGDRHTFCSIFSFKVFKNTFDSLSVELISSHDISGKLKSPAMMQFMLVILSNLRPIILLSTIRKILAICLIRRCWDRLSTRIPIARRNTTEQVFAIKMLAEKAITSSTYTIYLLLLDTSKAFDTVCRNKLLTDLGIQEVLEPDEMHSTAILISDVVLTVRVGKE